MRVRQSSKKGWLSRKKEDPGKPPADSYLSGLEHKLHRLYNNEEAPEEYVNGLHSNLVGYLEAAIAAGLHDKAQLRQVIEAIHQEHFGQSVAERAMERANPESKKHDWSYFDEPVWRRTD